MAGASRDATAFEAPSAGRIAVASASALVVAALILVVAVLPAEYGIDPLGSGRVLGLTSLANVQPTAIVPQISTYKIDSTDFVLGAYQAVEYKYRIEKGGTMLFSWKADGGNVLFDQHSEPAGGPAGYAESFDRREANEAHGAYTAPFAGIHGWYWENRGRADVTIKLTTAGFYSKAEEFFDGKTTEHELTDPHAVERRAILR
jgi:hypothetical protein